VDDKDSGEKNCVKQQKLCVFCCLAKTVMEKIVLNSKSQKFDLIGDFIYIGIMERTAWPWKSAPNRLKKEKPQQGGLKS